MRQNGTRSRRARAASQPGSQHGELAAWRGRAKPCSISQRAARRLRNDHHARITSVTRKICIHSLSSTFGMKKSSFCLDIISSFYTFK